MGALIGIGVVCIGRCGFGWIRFWGRICVGLGATRGGVRGGGMEIR